MRPREPAGLHTTRRARRRYARHPMADQLTVVIMAAGHGTRMKSQLAKVLHPVCGQPMVHWVVAAARAAGATDVVCVTRPGEGVAEALPEGTLNAEQTEGEGTGSAVLAARDHVDPDSTVIVLSGDVPLTSAELVAELHERHLAEEATATLLTTSELDPAGYGRIVRGAGGAVDRIVETKHAADVPPEVLAIREINIGTYAFRARELFAALDRVGETSGERYLTDVFPLLLADGGRVVAHETADVSSAMGVNTRADLAAVQEIAQRRIVDALARSGVTFESPGTACIDAEVEVGPDTTIAAGVTLKGATTIGAACTIGPQTTVVDSEVGDGTTVLHSYLSDCVVADGATVGPFAYLRPEANIGPGAKIGTFVEVKKSNVGAGAKVPHLSYIGDADIGERANVGGGAITANYHRKVKNRTVIGRDAKTGVHNSFVAPVRVGDGAYTGAGSVIADDVPDGALGIARSEQKNVEGYAKRVEEGSGQ
jgi:bifunctional UDP-N-acetylglucosamine pyrophosphorylase / glucosamine-1-phosphate N-acetyltransferase